MAWHPHARTWLYGGSFHDSARYVELLADFIGIFDDLTDELEHPALHSDPAVGYPEGQSLAEHLRRGGSRGLIYPSAPGTCAWRELSGLLRAARHPERPTGRVVGSCLGWDAALLEHGCWLTSQISCAMGGLEK